MYVNDSTSEVKIWSNEDVNLGEYIDKFIDDGFEDMEILLTISEQDLTDMNIKKIFGNNVEDTAKWINPL